jgi:hypothetical protein
LFGQRPEMISGAVDRIRSGPLRSNDNSAVT